MKLNHVALWTEDLERLLAFYSTHFDCNASKKYTNPKKRFSSYFLEFRDGGRLELMHSDDMTGSDRGRTYGYAHIAISLGSEKAVEEFTKRFEENGGKVEGLPRWTGDGYFESVISDPDGNLIEITI